MDSKSIEELLRASPDEDRISLAYGYKTSTTPIQNFEYLEGLRHASFDGSRVVLPYPIQERRSPKGVLLPVAHPAASLIDNIVVCAVWNRPVFIISKGCGRVMRVGHGRQQQGQGAVGEVEQAPAPLILRRAHSASRTDCLGPWRRVHQGAVRYDSKRLPAAGFLDVP